MDVGRILCDSEECNMTFVGCSFIKWIEYYNIISVVYYQICNIH